MIRMMGKKWLGNDMDGSGRDLISIQNLRGGQ
jgi:hypothetical protein